MSQINLKGEEGTIAIDISELSRFRHATNSEQGLHPNTTTRLDYMFTLYVANTPEEILARIAQASADERKRFAALTMPSKAPVWFRGSPSSKGPIPIPPSLRKQGIQSALQIGGSMQYVRETPQQVHDLLAAIGGKAIPIIELNAPIAEARRGGEALTENKVWDSDVPELQIQPDLETQ